MAEKKTILAIDDDPFTLKILINYLSPVYEIVVANSAADATQILSSKVPALILLDIEMPDISGFEFLHTIKKNPRVMKVPVLVVSGHSDAEFVTHAKKSGASDLVSKPIDKDDLFKKIDFAFSTPTKNIFGL